MAKKRRTSRKPGRKEALAVIILAMLVGLARQMLAPSYDLSNIPDYDGTSAYAVIDRNQPSFTEEEYTTGSYEYYSELDSLGRRVTHPSATRYLEIHPKTSIKIPRSTCMC